MRRGRVLGGRPRHPLRGARTHADLEILAPELMCRGRPGDGADVCSVERHAFGCFVSFRSSCYCQQESWSILAFIRGYRLEHSHSGYVKVADRRSMTVSSSTRCSIESAKKGVPSAVYTGPV